MSASWCPDCGRIVGIGCACDLSFAEKVKGQTVNLGTFKAVRT